MNLRTLRCAMSVFLLVSLSSGLIAAEWYVAPAPLGNDSNAGTNESPFATVQRGIDASSDGDTVIVAQGTYVEKIHFNGKNTVLTSADPLDPGVVGSTIIDGNRAGSVVTFSGTETEACILSGFTIRNGEADLGGGICGGADPNRTHATIRNNMIGANRAVESGGGLYGCDGTIRNNTIAGNLASRGGGLNLCNGTIEDNTITANSAYSAGGLRQCDGIIQNNIISGNSASWGGGLYYCNGIMRSNTITGNFATWGGGLYECQGAIQSNTISSNTASIYGGGLVFCNGTIQSNIIRGNLAQEGAGLASCHGTTHSNTITTNTAGAYGGGLAYCEGTARNCIIWGNTALTGPQVYESNMPTYSCIQEWSGGGEGNMASQPEFLDPNAADYRLQAGSPCIDAGYNDPALPATDIAGMHRIMFGGKSLTVDMGAYEYYVNALSPELGGNAVLTWSSLAGKTYSVLCCSDLVTWQTAAETVPSLGDTTTTWTDTTAPFLSPSVRTRYYRTVEK